MRSFVRKVTSIAILLSACSDGKTVEPKCEEDCAQTDDPGDDDSAGQSGGSDARVVELDARTPPPAKPDASVAADAAVKPDASTPTPGNGSTGCGASNVTPAGAGTIDVDGTTRDYIVALPQDYDPNKKYKLVYAWHGLGGTAAQIARSWYGLQRASMNSTIFVAGQGLAANGGGAGWPNTGGRDVAFVKALHARLLGSYCIDQDRVFSVGMSYGGIMSNTLGCQMGDVFRAIAPMSGSGPNTFRGTTCTGQVAAWLAHGTEDMTVPFASGEGSRDHWIAANHCQQTTAPTDPTPCVAYQGCDDGHPVHWCQFDGGHTIPQFASAAIWKFLSQF